MLISAIIARIDALKPNSKYTSVTKLDWINQLDGAIWNEVYKHTGFSDVMRIVGMASYSLPTDVDFSLVINVYVDGEEIFKIDYKDFETTGYFRGTDGKLNIYPVPITGDTVAGLRIAYRLPFVPHAAITEAVYASPPYDKVYDDYIFAMTDKYDQEIEKYQNSIAFYNGSFDEYAAWYNDQKGV